MIRARAASLILGERAGWVIPVVLYLLAAAVLLSPWPFNALPAWAYNWEGYTAWRWSMFWEQPVGPTFEIWAINDGLMTDSGQGPLVGLPVAIGFALGGLSVDAMRVPVMLLAAAAAPLLWIFGRRIAGPGPATLATLLLMASPAFLLYGRTATLVGVSLVPLLLTAIALVRVVDAPADDGWRWRREGILGCTLLLGIYSYAPVRLLWPIAIAVLGYAAFRVPDRRNVLIRTALFCLLIVPAAIVAIEQLTSTAPDPARAALGYFHARGEHVVALRADPSEVQGYLREPVSSSMGGWETLRLLLVQNTADLGGLLLDRGTNSALTDYWNANGRFWPWFLVPFAVIGCARIAWEGSRTRPALIVPLLLVAGLTLPLLLTSRVHIGRLLPALPFALLIVSVGAWTIGAWLADRAPTWASQGSRAWFAPLLAGALMIPVGVSAHHDFGVSIAPSREALTVAALMSWHADAMERGGAVLVEDPALGDEIERVHAATYRLDLDRLYRFVDLRRPLRDPDDPRPHLFWRGALGALAAGEIAKPCERLWFITPEVSARFLDAWHGAGCRGTPNSVVLP